MSNREENRDQMTHPLDKDIKRNRKTRFTVLIIYLIAVAVTAVFIGQLLAMSFFGDSPLLLIAHILITGSALGVGLALIEKLFIIRNNTVGMFVTQDTLASLLGQGDVNINYGPGTHVCYPWERRLKSNNISLEEATNEIEFPIQCEDGDIRAKGSYRIRPDMNNPVAFLTGVAAVADEIKDLIIADVVAYFKGKPVLEVVRGLKEINDELIATFQNKHSDLEKRFGVHITDVTLSQLLPTGEVQRTISAISEARAIATGTEHLLGIPAGEINKWLQEGKVTSDDVKEARDRFLAISGNLEGMDIKRHDFNFAFSGLDPKAIEAITELARSPVGQAYLAQGAVKSGKGTTAKQKSGGKQE